MEVLHLENKKQETSLKSIKEQGHAVFCFPWEKEVYMWMASAILSFFHLNLFIECYVTTGKTEHTAQSYQ